MSYKKKVHLVNLNQDGAVKAMWKWALEQKHVVLDNEIIMVKGERNCWHSAGTDYISNMFKALGPFFNSKNKDRKIKM